jgi:hypothetical protein
MQASFLNPPTRLIGQLLILLVIDNTAGFSLFIEEDDAPALRSSPSDDPWMLGQHAPILTPSRMMWYRKIPPGYFQSS